jgi:Golgi nucleoside diphosphatase
MANSQSKFIKNLIKLYQQSEQKSGIKNIGNKTASGQNKNILKNADKLRKQNLNSIVN